MKISEVPLNAVRIQLPPELKKDPRPVKGGDLFPSLHGQVFHVARKHSGKTVCLYNELKACMGEHTVVVAFVPTLHSDPVWLSIQKMIEARGNEFRGYTSIKDADGHHLQELIAEMKKQALERELKAKEAELTKRRKKGPKYRGLLVDSDGEDSEAEHPPRESKWQYPDWIIVLDDISNELKDPALKTLMKMNRHFRSKVLISSQYAKDLLPEQCKQIDYWLLFAGHDQDTLEKIHRDACIAVPFETFRRLYEYATMLPYQFLYVDQGAKPDKMFRIGFSRQLVLNDG